jgi:hypothetical protein
MLWGGTFKCAAHVSWFRKFFWSQIGAQFFQDTKIPKSQCLNSTGEYPMFACAIFKQTYLRECPKLQFCISMSPPTCIFQHIPIRIKNNALVQRQRSTYRQYAFSHYSREPTNITTAPAVIALRHTHNSLMRIQDELLEAAFYYVFSVLDIRVVHQNTIL